jgi:uncharacterized protein (TIGR02594 family)
MQKSYNQLILAAAESYLGLEEWPGTKHNPRIVEMFARSGNDWVNDDETAWCAAFVGAVLAELGLPNSGKLNARSYESYAQSVPIDRAMPGDIVVLWRGSRTSWMGHVAFFVRWDGDNAILRGGNQGNRVSDMAYPRDRIVAVRRADGVEAQGKRPVLRQGDAGAFVYDLQTMLVQSGYTLGRIDGDFGSSTRAALTKFQADRGLVPDGIAGDKTWAELARKKPKPLRDVTMDDLKKGESRTIAEVEKGKKSLAISGAGLGVSYVGTQVEEVAAIVSQAEGIGDVLSGIAPHVLVLGAVCVVGFLIFKNFDRISAIRLSDAKTGANNRI